MSYNITEKKTIKETLTAGFHHVGADTWEGGPLIFTPNWGPKGRKILFGTVLAPPPPPPLPHSPTSPPYLSV